VICHNVTGNISERDSRGSGSGSEAHDVTISPSVIKELTYALPQIAAGMRSAECPVKIRRAQASDGFINGPLAVLPKNAPMEVETPVIVCTPLATSWI